MDFGQVETEVIQVDLTTGDYTVMGLVMTGEMTIEAIDDNGEVTVSFDAPVGTIQV